MIQGYPQRASVVPGGQLLLHISTDAPCFRITFHRWADGFAPMHDTGWLDGQYAERCGTPPDFRLLAASPLGDRWQERPPREMYKAGEGIHTAAMGIFTRNGTVFTAGTTDWAQVLGQDVRVDRITRNVIDGLLQPSSHSTRLANR